MWRKVVGWVSAVAVLAGLVMGLSPLSSGGTSCGSVFSPDNYWLGPRSCDDIRNVMAIPVRILLIGGGLGLLIAGIATLDARMQGKQKRESGTP